MKHKGDTDNIFDPRLHHLFENVNQFDCLINVTPQSQRSFVLSPSLYSFCLLYRYSVYSADIRNSSLPEYTVVRENDNYFVMHSSSLHLHGRYFLVTTHLICKFRSINLKFYHLSCVLHIQLLVPLCIDSVKVSPDPQINPGSVRPCSIENTHTCTFTCTFALCHYFVKLSH